MELAFTYFTNLIRKEADKGKATRKYSWTYPFSHLLLRLILLLRFSALITFLSFAEMLSN